MSNVASPESLSVHPVLSLRLSCFPTALAPGEVQEEDMKTYRFQIQHANLCSGLDVGFCTSRQFREREPVMTLG